MSLPKIGWIGTGVMGKSMCKHLLNKGYQLAVFNRTKSKTDELVELGAKYQSVSDIAREADYVFLMLGYPRDVEHLVFEADGGLLNLMRPGTTLVDHTTSSPALAAKIAAALKQKNIASFDAPVSGGDIGARNGQLVSMCGGDSERFAAVEAILKTYSKNVQLLGPAGAGQSTKIVNQIAITGQMIGVCEALVFGYKAGLNLQQVLDTISGGAAASFSLTAYSPRILKGDFAPGFFVEHFVKDMEIALDECRRLGIALPGLSLVHQLYRGLMAQGGGQYGTQALIKVLENLNNVQVTPK